MNLLQSLKTIIAAKSIVFHRDVCTMFARSIIHGSMKFASVLAAFSLLLFGCSQGGPLQATAQPGYIDRRALGEEWPLTVDSGILSCSGGAITFTSEGRVYAVNGLAMTWKRGVDIAPIWAAPAPQWTSFQGKKTNMAPPKKNIGPLIDAGRALCDQERK